MAIEPLGVVVAPELVDQFDEVWQKATSEQRVCRVLGLQPSEYAFIHVRTGTHYVLDPSVALFAADMANWLSPFAYLGVDELEPWKDAEHVVPGPPLLKEQRALPPSVNGYPENASGDRRTPLYGHSEVWSSLRPWPLHYHMLRESMRQSSAQKQKAASRLRLPATPGARTAVGPSSVGFGESASNVASPSMVAAMEGDNNPYVRAFANRWRARHSQRVSGPPSQPVSQLSSQDAPIPGQSLFKEPASLLSFPAPTSFTPTFSLVNSVLRAQSVMAEEASPWRARLPLQQSPLAFGYRAPEVQFRVPPPPPHLPTHAVQWPPPTVYPSTSVDPAFQHGFAPVRQPFYPQQPNYSQQQQVSSSAPFPYAWQQPEMPPTSVPQFPSVPPTPEPSVRSTDEDLRRKVEKLENEVRALRGEVPSGQEIRKFISANQWIVTDQKKFD